jgi:hypothetical protein
MKCINSKELYTKRTVIYELTQEEQQMTVEQLANKCYAPFGYTNAYINNGQFTITIYND